MVTRRVRQKETTEDFLGLATIGSLIANIAQLVSRKTLENNFGVLKKYVADLEHRHKEAINRNQQISNAYMSLRKINEGLAQQVRTLDGMITKSSEENTKLKIELDALRMRRAAETKDTLRKKRSVVKKEGTNA